MIHNLNIDYSQKMQRCHEYVEALEEERRKIQVFQRELPLCLELVTQAIEACRKELSGTSTEYVHGQSECSEQTTSDCGPVFEEFIPIKRSSSSDEDDEDGSRKSEKENADVVSKSNTCCSNDKKKSDWLRSVQLWNQPSEPPLKEGQGLKKAKVVEVKGNGGAFKPFHKEKNKIISDEKETTAAVQVPATSSTAADIAIKIDLEKEEEKQQHGHQQGHRKQRRCWSPELHRRFLQALQQLGGSHVATPKQIRELMKVDGLTNDEVKSHLQKYRLHTRRPSPVVHGGGNAQTPQFVVMGGIWMPPAEYPTATATSASPERSDRIYAPVAAPPAVSNTPVPPQRSLSIQRPKRLRSERCDSPARSSTHTTTASPAS